MAFDVRSLRVQLPCKETTVIPAEEYDAQLQAHQYWRVIAKELGGFGLRDPECECTGNPSVPTCLNESQDLNLFAFIDIRVLPILRRQLEARLREINQAEEAVAKATGGG